MLWLLLLILPPAPTSGSVCNPPTGYTRRDPSTQGSYFKLYQDDDEDFFHNAKVKCDRDGAALATLERPDDLDEISHCETIRSFIYVPRSMLVNNNCFSSERNRRWFLGGHPSA